MKRRRNSSVAQPDTPVFGPGQVEHVLQAVRDAGGTIPSSFHRSEGWQDLPLRERTAEIRRCADARDEFASAISWAFTRLGTYDDVHNDARARQRAAALKDVVKLTRALREKLTDDKLSLALGLSAHMPPIEGTETVVHGRTFVRNFSVGSAMEGVLALQHAAEGRLRWLRTAGLDERAIFSSRESQTPGAVPAYYSALKEAYVEFIGEWNIERDAREASIGPELAFVVEVQRQAGQTVQTPAAILKAYQRLKSPDKVSDNS